MLNQPKIIKLKIRDVLDQRPPCGPPEFYFFVLFGQDGHPNVSARLPIKA